MSFIVTGIFSERQQFDTSKIIKQIEEYLADERWIALSSDLYKKQVQKQDRFFEMKTQKEGIGIITVTAGRIPNIIQKPRHPRIQYRPGYLQYYIDEMRISDWLSEQEISHRQESSQSISQMTIAPTKNVLEKEYKIRSSSPTSQSKAEKSQTKQATCIYGSCK